MLLSIGAIFSFIWKNRSERFYKDRFELVSKLHESEKHFQLLFDTIPDAIFIRDFEGHFLLVNSTACTRLGYSSEELLTITARDICAPKFVAGLEERIEKSNKNTQTVMETEHLSKDGRVIATELINRVIWYGDKQAVLVVARDITERKWADRERRVMYEITHGATTTANLDEFLNLVHRSLKKVIYAENFFVALYNKNTGLFSFPYFADKYDEAPPPLPLHKSCTAYIFRKGIPLLISADLFEKLKEQNEVELIGTNSPSWLGVPLRTPAGTIGVLVLQHYEEANIYNERDLQFLESVGNQIAVAIERKKAEDALRESELNLNVILESTADGILAIDNEGKTIKTNKRFAELWSVPQPLIEAGVAFGADKSLLNFAVAQLNDPEDFVAKVQQISETVDYDMDMFNLKDGRIFERFSAPLLMRGSSIGRVWSFRDITDRIIAEQEIKKRNEQLSQVNAEKDKFFSIIAHDLKSPFTGLLGMTEMMAAEDDDITKAELLKFGKEMHGAVLTIFRLIENLLDWAQMQKGSISFAPEPLCLQTVVSQSVELAKQRALQKGISIINDVPETVKIEADKLMVGTILRNLISNAVKFTKREGIITVSATAKGNGMIEVSVRDTGVGMNKDVMGKLFKLEEKISSTGTDGERSNGLGLLLCKEFVQRHGGSIYAKSELGKGSVFSFTIPMAG
jgi:PAS domain S-box-containing protein